MKSGCAKWSHAAVRAFVQKFENREDTPEAAGDYMAGPSHVPPTGGAARYGAPLGVYDFVSRTSVIRYSRAALAAQAEKIKAFARVEGLEAHARAVEVRASSTPRSG